MLIKAKSKSDHLPPLLLEKEREQEMKSKKWKPKVEKCWLFHSM
jgi:hypothetical protein